MISKNTEFFSERLKFTGIALEDAESLVKWRSDNQIIKYFLNPTPLCMEQHLKWFSSYLKNETRYDFVIRLIGDDTPIGVVGISSIDYSNNTCEINYAIGESAYHGKGYASEAVRALIDFSVKTIGTKTFFAEIHQDNISSEKLIRKLGFAYSKAQGVFNVFTKKIGHIYFRVDGNEQIGTGHMMRCLAIADAARKNNIHCTFIVADEKMTSLIENKNFEFICLNSIWNDLDTEIEKLCELINSKHIEKLIVDTYFVTHNYMKALCEHTKVIYFDDLYKSVFSCNALINYNCYAHSLPYQDNYDDTKLFLGTEYAPLRSEFYGLETFCVKDKVRNILITTGGTDLFNAASRISKKLLSKISSDTNIFIVSGRFNKHIDELLELEKSDNRIKVFTQVERMSDLILECDIAISAGGTTLYELCACGIPTVMFVMADNQILAYEGITKELMLGGGSMLEDEEACVSGVCEGALRLISDINLRKSLSVKMQAAVDGKGAERIVKLTEMI